MSNLLHNFDFSRVLQDSISAAQSKRPARKRTAYRMREILRIEKQADREIWWEILSCGHRGQQNIPPDRDYFPVDKPATRRCYSCSPTKPCDALAKESGLTK